jgi:hypothetical protein
MTAPEHRRMVRLDLELHVRWLGRPIGTVTTRRSLRFL